MYVLHTYIQVTTAIYTIYICSLVMSPSRAGSSQGSSWAIFSSARLVTFSFQLRNFSIKARASAKFFTVRMFSWLVHEKKFIKGCMNSFQCLWITWLIYFSCRTSRIPIRFSSIFTYENAFPWNKEDFTTYISFQK